MVTDLGFVDLDQSSFFQFYSFFTIGRLVMKSAHKRAVDSIDFNSQHY